MSFKSVRTYFMVIVGGVFLAAIAILVMSNMGVQSENKITFYWTQVPGISLGMLMLISAVAGAIAFPIVKAFLKACLDLYKIRRSQDALEKQANEIAQKQLKQEAEDADSKKNL